jgi:ferric-dicitrate binding protein FerR (iron transport regulator)
MNTPPPHLRADRLWRQLANAQDTAMQRDPLPAPRVPGRSRLRKRPVGIALLALGMAAAAVVLLTHRAPPRTSISTSRLPGEVDRLLVADAHSDLPLRFSDGSSLTFRSGASGRMRRLGGDGAEVFLEQGRLEAHVVHTPSTLWLVHAGPYRVRVTGTRFAVVWLAARLDVSLFEGSVVIDGAVLGAGVPLHAGQRLSVDRGLVRTDPLAADEVAGAISAGLVVPAPAALPAAVVPAATAPAAAAPAPGTAAADPTAVVAHSGAVASHTLDASPVASENEPGPARTRAVDDNDWLALAKHGAYAEAFSAAKRAGWSRLCHRLDAHRLLTLGDVARYAGARARAREAFEALVRRFPHDPLAADAVFSLGRLAFESEQSDRAARWFRRYVDDWPHGPLADQAVGRLVECAIHMHDAEAARGAARAYLARAPRGPHAQLARLILRDGVGPTASVSP